MARWSSQSTHNDVSDFSDNPHLKRELKIWRLKITLIVALILGVVGLSARPLYLKFREDQIQRNLEHAKEAARLKDWGSARDKARSVLLARKGDFEAFRIWTQALGEMGEPRAYMAAVTLFTDTRAEDRDRLECIQVMAKQAPQAVALGAYASLDESLRNQADFRAAITPLLVSRGEVRVAETGLREVMTPDPSPAVRLELLRTLCARPTSERVAEARGIFRVLIELNASKEALAALLILGETPGGLSPGSDMIADLPAWVSSQPDVQTLHQLLALHPAMEGSAREKDRAIEIAVRGYLDVDPGILGTWLIRHDRSKQALELLKEPAKVRGDAFVAYLHALLKEGKEAEIDIQLRTPPPSCDMVEVEIVGALLYARRGDLAASSAAWTRALNQAVFDTSRNRFIEIARIAESNGAKDASTDAWVGAILSDWGPLPLYQDLLPMIAGLADKSRSEDLLAICRMLQRYERYHPDLENNVNYLALIHGVFRPRQVRDTLEKLLAEHPDMVELHSSLTLANLMAGDGAAALRHLPELRKAERVSPMMKDALEGTARLLTNQREQGIELLKKVQWKLFMRQERLAFRDIFTQLQLVELPLPELESPSDPQNPDEVPAWRKAVEAVERDRSADILPPLPPPKIPGAGSN